MPGSAVTCSVLMCMRGARNEEAHMFRLNQLEVWICRVTLSDLFWKHRPAATAAAAQVVRISAAPPCHKHTPDTIYALFILKAAGHGEKGLTRLEPLRSKCHPKMLFLAFSHICSLTLLTFTVLHKWEQMEDHKDEGWKIHFLSFHWIFHLLPYI